MNKQRVAYTPVGGVCSKMMIVDAEDNVIGVVTSGTMSPVLKKGIGMGYVKPEYAKAGTEFFIKVRNRNLKAQVVKAPFRK